jgi:hypothetical protein
MNDCRRVRNQLLREGEAASRRLGPHLAGCAGCSDFARRLVLARQALGRRASDPRPDPGFAARVQARLPRSGDMLGWAAFRALPAAVAVALALAAVGISQQPPPASPLLVEPNSDQLFSLLSLPGGALP